MKRESILGGAFVLVGVIWGTIVFLVGTTTIPHSPLSPSPVTQLVLQSLLPEGWSFFTRSPREPQLRFFSYQDSQLQPYKNFPNSNASNYFGMSRKSRAQGVEFAYLTQHITPDNWKDCTYNELLSKVQKDSIPWHAIDSPYSPSLLCGDLIVMQQEFVPWAWSKSKENIDMSAKFIKLKISCN